MYSYSTIQNQTVYVGERQIVGGVAIGIILFGKTGYPLPQGSVENATSFSFPVYYRAIEAASVESVVSTTLDSKVLEQLIIAGNEMRDQGCRAIIGACGFFANYLQEVQKAIDIPCFFSSLMQLPIILCSLPRSKKIGVLTANGNVLQSAPVLKNCGVNDNSRIIISGAEVLPEMQKILNGEGGYNPIKLEEGLIRLSQELLNEQPDIGAILLECSLFPTHGKAIQEVIKLPVFDFNTMINWVYSGVVKREYFGYI